MTLNRTTLGERKNMKLSLFTRLYDILVRLHHWHSSIKLPISFPYWLYEIICSLLSIKFLANHNSLS